MKIKMKLRFTVLNVSQYLTFVKNKTVVIYI